MIVALAGQKGGVGKSTLSVCLVAEALTRGLAVMLVDADPQGTARTWGAVAAENKFATPTLVAMGAGMHRPDQLPRLADAFDLVVIDCPPRAGEIQRSALLVADLVLLPCGPAAFDAWALASSLDVVREARGLRPDLQAAVVVTRKQRATALGQGAREVLAQGGLPILEVELGYRIAFQEATAAGQAVSLYAPRSEAAREIRALLDEVLAFEVVSPEPAVQAPPPDPGPAPVPRPPVAASRPRKNVSQQATNPPGKATRHGKAARQGKAARGPRASGKRQR